MFCSTIAYATKGHLLNVNNIGQNIGEEIYSNTLFLCELGYFTVLFLFLIFHCMNIEKLQVFVVLC